MKKEILEFICSLHGYLIRLKEIHWSTNSNSEHLLCDSIMDTIGGLEDELAETAMGLYGKKIQVGELKPYLPNAEDLKPMLRELQSETLAVKKKLTSEKESGLVNILDDIIAAAQKYQYRATQD